MALIKCDFFAESLGMNSSMQVILPQQISKGMIGMKSSERKTAYPVLYLLHGLSDDHSIWMRRTSIERYVAAMGLVVVMPNAHRSFYTDMKCGGKYFTFISEELPGICKSFFPISDKREDTFVAGLSMGGYGAFKLALRCPEKFAAAASLSGATDIAPLKNTWPDLFSWIFGDDEISGSDNDLLALATRAMQSDGPKTELFQYCGTEDGLYENNIRFRDHLRKIGYKHIYREKTGNHNWGFWDDTIQEVLAWLPIKKTSQT